MKKQNGFLLKGAIIAGALFMAIPAMATDYNSYSLQELSQMRGTMMNKSVEERNAFRDAWREKMQNATPEERSQYSRGRYQGRNNQSGQYGKNGQGNCDGTGYGRGQGHGRGHR